MTEELKNKVKMAAENEGIEPILLLAIVMTESSGNQFAMRYEPNWRYWANAEGFAVRNRVTVETERMLQSFSWGLTQIMGSVARELLFKDELTRLIDPDLNLSLGAKKLKTLTKKHTKLDDAVAAYNAGIPKLRADLKYFNQHYVDRVNKFMKELKGAI